MHGFFVAFGFGLVTAAILAFSAVAFSLQYGVSNHPNFAHGELLTIGAYAAYVSQTLTTNLVVGGAAAAVTGGLVAWGMNRGIVEPFVRARARSLPAPTSCTCCRRPPPIGWDRFCGRAGMS
ncbi:MAG: hypothetical protein E6H04_12435 [Bacillati bacterium ANGP1]|uniref:Branched-chain amino acid ABC transporter permease n=1 Tax=Candidatus Segetimicrobium genomatis TaxID=2569760 RepID=A0A537J518_9BACT|nr:MAG: hypothetical protein E6H04_12435 [Terrabacteria group bacterium ANGP1]